MTRKVTIENDAALASIWKIAQAHCGSDPAHDASHLERVAEWTARIAGSEAPEREALAAALLHDYVAVEKNSPDRGKAAEMSAAAARPLLERHGFAQDAVDRIAGAIAAHSFSRGMIPADALGRALQDADRLDALGSIGIMRTIATGTRLGSRWMHAEDLWALERPFDGKCYAIDHFFEKLLKLPRTMLTEAGRAEAQRRVEIMIAFLRELGREVGDPMPKEVECR